MPARRPKLFSNDRIFYVVPNDGPYLEAAYSLFLTATCMTIFEIVFAYKIVFPMILWSVDSGLSKVPLPKGTRTQTDNNRDLSSSVSALSFSPSDVVNDNRDLLSSVSALSSSPDDVVNAVEQEGSALLAQEASMAFDAINDALIDEGKAFMEMARAREKKNLDTINAHSRVFATLLIASLVLGCVRCRVALKKLNRKTDPQKWYRRKGVPPGYLTQYVGTIPEVTGNATMYTANPLPGQLKNLNWDNYIRINESDYCIPGFTSRISWTPGIFASITVLLLVAFQIGFYWMNDVSKRPEGFFKTLPAWKLDNPVTQLPSVITEACQGVPSSLDSLGNQQTILGEEEAEGSGTVSGGGERSEEDGEDVTA